MVQDVFWWFFLAKERPDSGAQHFQCVKKCAIRDEADVESVKVGHLSPGAVIEQLESCVDNGIVRIRCEAGWVSECTARGEMLLSKHAGPSAQHQYQLFDRASDNFAMLFMNVPDKQKDAFFENYHDALAQSVFAVWWTAYPKSRHKFEKPSFRQHICGMVAEWTTGRRAFANAIDSDGWTRNRLLRPENLDKETEEDERRRVVHQRYVDVIQTGRPTTLSRAAMQKLPSRGAHVPRGRSDNRAAMFATGETFANSTGDGEHGDGMDDGTEMADSEAKEADGIDVYSNSPFIQHFLLTHNCNPQSLMRSSRIDFAAYYAALPNSALLAGESIRINDEVITHYERLSSKTSEHIRVARRYTKNIKDKLEQHRDAVLSTSTHDYSSRIVSIVAQRDQLRRKALAQELGRATAMGSGNTPGGRKKGKGKGKAAADIADAQDEGQDENAIDEATAPSRLREANVHAQLATEDQQSASPGATAGGSSPIVAAGISMVGAEDGGTSESINRDPEQSKRAKAERSLRWQKELREAAEQSKEEPLKPLDPTQERGSACYPPAYSYTCRVWLMAFSLRLGCVVHRLNAFLTLWRHVCAGGRLGESGNSVTFGEPETEAARAQRTILFRDVSRRRPAGSAEEIEMGPPSALTDRQATEAVQLKLAKAIMLREHTTAAGGDSQPT